MNTLDRYKNGIKHGLIFKGTMKRSDLKKYISDYYNFKENEFNVIDFNFALNSLMKNKEIKEFKDPEFILEETYKISNNINSDSL